jgi:hypothetical protein
LAAHTSRSDGRKKPRHRKVSGAGSNQATYPSFRIDVQRPNIAGADDRDF